MSEVVEKLPDFPGFAVKYTPSSNPFFKAICLDNLRLLASNVGGGDLSTLGSDLLKLIENAKPRFRGDFPSGVNVMMVPVDVQYTQAGYMDMGGTMVKDKTRGISLETKDGTFGCNFWKRRGGSANAAVNPTDSTNGQGSVCKMMFTNAQMLTSKGEAADAYIVLAHELIHSYHCLHGVKIDGNDEEIATTGLGVWAEDRFTENSFRKKFGRPLRVDYY